VHYLSGVHSDVALVVSLVMLFSSSIIHNGRKTLIYNSGIGRGNANKQLKALSSSLDQNQDVDLPISQDNAKILQEIKDLEKEQEELKKISFELKSKITVTTQEKEEFKERIKNMKVEYDKKLDSERKLLLDRIKNEKKKIEQERKIFDEEKNMIIRKHLDLQEELFRLRQRETPTVLSQNNEIATFNSMLESSKQPRKYPPFIWETTEDAESVTLDHVCTFFTNKTLPTQQHRILTIKTLMEAMALTLEKHQIPYWLTHGTLLGSYRNNAIIPWDSDADIAMTLESLESFVTVVSKKDFEWEGSCKECTLIFRKGKHAHVIPFKFVNTTDGVYVDCLLFMRNDPSPISKKLLMWWPYRCGTCTRDSWTIDYGTVFPLSHDCVFEGRKYFCPQNTKLYLESWYKNLSPIPPKGWNPKTGTITPPACVGYACKH